MLQKIKSLFGGGKAQTDIAEVLSRDAVIIDVRTPGEYASGHLKRSVNIPLSTLSSQTLKFPKEKPIITCCASGVRSASARTRLLMNGYKEVYNGGSWRNLKQYDR